MTLFRKSFIHKDGKIIKLLVLLNEQPTSLASLITTINPEHIENIKIEKKKFNF